MNFWKLSFCFAVVAIIHLSKINADEHQASDETSKGEEVTAADVYADSYANYYAQWTPDLYQKYGLPQNYYQSGSRKPLRKQGVSDLMTEMLGTEAAITLGLTGALLGLVSVIGLVVNANSISSLSTDQDSICNVVQAYSADTTLTTIADLTGATTDAAALNSEFITIFNKIENKINALSSPDCN